MDRAISAMKVLFPSLWHELRISVVRLVWVESLMLFEIILQTVPAPTRFSELITKNLSAFVRFTSWISS